MHVASTLARARSPAARMHRDAGAVRRVRAAVPARADAVARQTHAAVGQLRRLAARCPDPKTMLHIAPYKMAHDYGPPHAVSPNGTCNSQNSPNTGDREAKIQLEPGVEPFSSYLLRAARCPEEGEIRATAARPTFDR